MKDKVQSVAEWLELPEPSFPTLSSSNEKGSVFHVFKVGFLAVPKADCAKYKLKAQLTPDDKYLLPTAAIEFAGEPQICRLPVELTAWVFDSVAMAEAGMKPFPSRVEFGVLNGRAYAEHVL